jgi:hypothetical protein
MKKLLTLFCLGLAARDGGLQRDRPLQRGMTEQEVTQLQGKQAPDRSLCELAALLRPTRFLARCTSTGGGCGRKVLSSSRTCEESGW